MSAMIRPIPVTMLLCLRLPLAGADSPPAAVPSIVDWQVVPSLSIIGFHGVSTLHSFDGKATVTQGQVHLTPGHERGSVTVSSSSMDTDDTSRDRTMHQDHMHSDVYPDITFSLVKLEMTSHGAIAHGTWAMHGVTRPVDVPVTLPPIPAARGLVHLTAACTLDMRQWNIPVPSTMGFIHVHPEIDVSIDLALVPAAPAATHAAASRTPATAVVQDLLLLDQRGVTHDLGTECPGRLLLLFTVDERIRAKRCDDALASRLDPAMPLIRVIDGSSYALADRDTIVHRLQDAVTDPHLSFLLDWTGAVRSRLGLGKAAVQCIGFSPAGTVTGALEARADAPVLTAILALIGRHADPPFTAAELSTARSGRR